jgi:hypothetical protein
MFPKRRSLRWFLFAGFIGLGVAVMIAGTRPASPVALLFWPMAILGLADPTGPLDKTVFAVVMFGGNFLLYGTIGAIAGAAADRLQR